MHHIPFRLFQSNLSARSGRLAFSQVGIALALFVLGGCDDSAPGDGSGGASSGGSSDPGVGGGGSANGSGGSSDSSGGGAATTGGAAATGGAGTGSASSGGSANDTGGAGGSSSGGSGATTGSDDPSLPDLSGKTETACSVTVTSADLSDVVSTVGIVEFSSDLAGQTDAVIEFGLSTEYGLVAPVDFAGTNRTLLLGMTTDSEYHYRILVVSGDAYCYSPDQTISTGPLPAGGPSHITPEVGSSSAPKTPGFVLTSDFNGEWIYIFNQDGRIVWFYQAPFGQLSRSLMSFDGKRMFARELNVGRDDEALFLEVGMDGSDELVTSLSTSHHDFTVTSSGDIVYIRKTPETTCDSLYRHPAGAADDSGDTRLFDVEEAFPSGGGDGGLGNESCHTNSVHFQVLDGGFTASDLTHNAYFKLSSTGELEWVLGSADSTFSGGGTDWDRQHGHHLLAADTLLFFNNGSMQGNNSVIREVALDAGSSMAEFTAFSYASEYGSGTMGDVQRLPSGNTVVTYSNDGVVQEVGPDLEPVQTFTLSTGTGYGCHRPSLYGAPPE